MSYVHNYDINNMKYMSRIFIYCTIVAVLLSCSGPQTRDSVNSLPTVKNDTLNQLPEKQSLQGELSSCSFSNWVLFGFVLVEGLAISFLFSKIRNNSKKIKELNERVEKRKREIYEIKYPYGLGDDVKKMSQPLGQQCESYSQPTKIGNDLTIAPIPKEETDIPSNGNTSGPDTISEFLRHYKSGVLEQVKEEEAFYEVVYSPGNQMGRFYFVGNDNNAIKNKSAQIDGVCETSGISSTAKRIKTLKWGECERLSDGKWKVTKKTKITFEQ